MRTILEQHQIDADEFEKSIRDAHVSYASNLNYIDDKKKELADISQQIEKDGKINIAQIESDYRSNDRMLQEKTRD